MTRAEALLAFSYMTTTEADAPFYRGGPVADEERAQAAHLAAEGDRAHEEARRLGATDVDWLRVVRWLKREPGPMKAKKDTVEGALELARQELEAGREQLNDCDCERCEARRLVVDLQLCKALDLVEHAERLVGEK